MSRHKPAPDPDSVAFGFWRWLWRHPKLKATNSCQSLGLPRPSYKVTLADPPTLFPLSSTNDALLFLVSLTLLRSRFAHSFLLHLLIQILHSFSTALQLSQVTPCLSSHSQRITTASTASVIHPAKPNSVLPVILYSSSKAIPFTTPSYRHHAILNSSPGDFRRIRFSLWR
jgi:hypothetical protein